MNKRLRIGTFPRTRLRRNRQYPWYRNLISETKLNTEDLILPLFITEGKKIEEHIKTMPSIKRYSIDTVLKKIEEVKKFRIPAIALFPYVEKKLKTFDAKEALNKNNLILGCEIYKPAIAKIIEKMLKEGGDPCVILPGSLEVEEHHRRQEDGVRCAVMDMMVGADGVGQGVNDTQARIGEAVPGPCG